MAKLFDKMMNVMGFGDMPDEEDEDDVITTPPELDEFPSLRSSKKINSKIVNIHTNIQMKVVLTNPETYEDAQEICDHIKSKKPVVVNLEAMDHVTSQRVMDFLSGACYSLDGTIQRVANNIFIIAPENVDISGNFKEELKTRGIILPWVNGAK